MERIFKIFFLFPINKYQQLLIFISFVVYIHSGCMKNPKISATIASQTETYHDQNHLTRQKK